MLDRDTDMAIKKRSATVVPGASGAAATIKKT